MKIEKISDNQIRCTLSKNDLIDREMKISELAYGTEKAKALFRDMIQQAFYEFGFEVDDIPLMIEAIPVSTECLILVITKVEDPDELDTRFSKFSSFNTHDLSDKSYDDDDSFDDEDDMINTFEHLEEFSGNLGDNSKDIINDTTSDTNPKKEVHIPVNLTRVYSFRSLGEVTELANILLGTFQGNNTLYKDPINGVYYLVISISRHTPEEFNKISNLVSEYGKHERATYATPLYYEEHYEVIVKDQALQILSVM